MQEREEGSNLEAEKILNAQNKNKKTKQKKIDVVIIFLVSLCVICHYLVL